MKMVLNKLIIDSAINNMLKNDTTKIVNNSFFKGLFSETKIQRCVKRTCSKTSKYCAAYHERFHLSDVTMQPHDFDLHVDSLAE